MKTRSLIPLCLALFATHTLAVAGDFHAGLYNSLKGVGVGIDYDANEDICNSYILYADIFGLPDGSIAYPGIKLVYLHQNSILRFCGNDAEYVVFIAPGFSTGYVRDHGKANPGYVTAADFSLCVRMNTSSSIRLELGFLAEIGLISRFSSTGSQVGIYSNGLRQCWYPSIKIMYRFR